MGATTTTYSFLDVTAAFEGPGAAFPLAGSGEGNAEEGITVEATEDINTMTVGADGSVMHSLHANKSGMIRVRLLKTAPLNSLLSAAYNFQTASGANHGKNTITIANPVTGDNVTCTGVAFKKATPLTYAKDGQYNDWEFHAGQIDRVLGGLT